MIKFIVCPDCLGSGFSSAYLGSFTAEEMREQGEEFMEDYMEGRYDRKCDHCNGLRVVKGCKAEGCDEEVAVIHSIWSGRMEFNGCVEHDVEARGSAESAAESAAERAMGC